MNRKAMASSILTSPENIAERKRMRQELDDAKAEKLEKAKARTERAAAKAAAAAAKAVARAAAMAEKAAATANKKTLPAKTPKKTPTKKTQLPRAAKKTPINRSKNASSSSSEDEEICIQCSKPFETAIQTILFVAKIAKNQLTWTALAFEVYSFAKIAIPTSVKEF